mgnify:CR=1 FL=1
MFIQNYTIAEIFAVCQNPFHTWSNILLQLKQKDHGSHRSPEKTVQINKRIW